MKILSVNAGSSSLKFRLYEMPEENLLISGVFERIGIEGSFYTIKYNGEKIKKEVELKNHKDAFNYLVSELLENKVVTSLEEIKGIGHRAVQGGSSYNKAVFADEEVINNLEKYISIAPLHNPAPYMFPELDTLNYIETLLTDDHSGVDKPAAIVLETVQADGGINVFDVEWLKGIRAICDKHDILMVVDDVQVGCARTGTFFSFERAGIVPDIVTQSKSIGGYGMPFALVLIRPELDLWEPGEHNGTFRGYQLSMIAAKAGLEVMLNEHVEERVQKLSAVIAQAMEEIQALSPEKIKTRGMGFVWGVDFWRFDHDGVTSKKVLDECFKNGLIVERVGRGNTVVKVMPELLIEEETLKKGLDILKNSISNVIR